MSVAESAWLWVGAAGMALGTVVFMVLARTDREENVHHYVTSWMITIVAAVAYLAMAMGQGRVETANLGRPFFYARYLDWAITTPLLLLSLVTLALPEDPWGTPELTLGLLGTDLLMIATGFFAALSDSVSEKFVWYAVSCGAFCAVLYILFGPLHRHAARKSHGEYLIYMRCAGFLAVLWFCYPLVWLFGQEGLGLNHAALEAFLFTALDLAAKVLFGLAVVLDVRALSRARARIGMTPTPSARSASAPSPPAAPPAMTATPLIESPSPALSHASAAFVFAPSPDPATQETIPLAVSPPLAVPDEAPRDVE